MFVQLVFSKWQFLDSAACNGAHASNGPSAANAFRLIVRIECGVEEFARPNQIRKPRERSDEVRTVHRDEVAIASRQTFGFALAACLAGCFSFLTDGGIT